MRLFLILSCLLIVGCAHSGPRFDRAASLERAAEDRYEYDNRQMYDLNRKIDKYSLKPATDVYRAVLPPPVRYGLNNLYSTMGEPSNALNAAMQGKPKRFFRAIDRLLINSILGFGVIDRATQLNLPRQPNDFGQTLAVWGVHSGPFIMAPVIGPQTARDGVGFLVDFFLDPLDLLQNKYLSQTERSAKLAGRIIVTRARVGDQAEQFLAGSADEYATVRSAWLQMRRAELYDGNPPLIEDDEYIEPYPDDLPPPEAAK
ncbi:MAG: VacJ family lipoprotein [Sphingomonadaceae bacterium]